MPVRHPACDPCRFSKLACDHGKPVCKRCNDRNEAASCIYRAAPFKKRKRLPSDTITVSSLREDTRHNSADAITSRGATEQPLLSSTPKEHTPTSRNYPNPGFLGSSSHTTFFNHLPGSNNGQVQEIVYAVDDESQSLGRALLEQIHREYDIASCLRLVRTWLSRGVNLALAGAFSEECALSTLYVFDEYLGRSPRLDTLARKLFQNTCQPLRFDADTTIDSFCEQFTQENARWETIGFFFTCVTRAIWDINYFSPLYDTRPQRHRLLKLAMQFSDRSLETALSLDCLNDLQLMLQYENWISHSYIDGDQSYRSWRKLGDVVSSLFCLGYHERVGGDDQLPVFLRDFRQATFARTFSADKNVSVFLGRPPRIHRKYCRFQLPGMELPSSILSGNSDDEILHFQWNAEPKMDYMSETAWGALCAFLKERVLDLFQEESYEKRLPIAESIQADAEALWANLPPQFRLEGPVNAIVGRPTERDFLLSVRLNYLHVLFLIKLVLRPKLSEPDGKFLNIPANMLSLIVEAILLKDEIESFGTTLEWKVILYGLSAAGIICVSLLNNSFPATDVSFSKVVQDLNVLVAVVETGALISMDHPNYALLARATTTIKGLIDRLLGGDATAKRAVQAPPTGENQIIQPPIASMQSQDIWDPWDNTFNLQDFEVGFWSNLAEHPFMAGPDSASDNVVQDFSQL